MDSDSGYAGIMTTRAAGVLLSIAVFALAALGIASVVRAALVHVLSSLPKF